MNDKMYLINIVTRFSLVEIFQSIWNFITEKLAQWFVPDGFVVAIVLLCIGFNKIETKPIRARYLWLMAIVIIFHQKFDETLVLYTIS